jgi:hypothetical protein
MFKIPKTSEAVGSFKERWETGVCIGTTVRDGMSLIGTPTGVYKVGTIRRKPYGEQWSQDRIKKLVGSPSYQSQGSAPEELPLLPRRSSKRSR